LTNNRIIRFLFITSVWLFIALNGYKAVIHLIKAGSFSETYPGGYSFKVFIAPFFLISFELFLWFKMFRRSRHPSRIFAGIIGAYIWLMIIFVNVVVANLYDRNLPLFMLWLYAYAGAGHLAYAFFGKERGY
jgi:hypothetical protein